jgi:hypothetical protein
LRRSSTGVALRDRIVWLLSPSAWWSDLFVNIPVAWILASLLARLLPAIYVPAFFVLYWCTALAGSLLLRASDGRVEGTGTKDRRMWLPPLFYTVIIAVFLALRVFAPLL